MISVILLGQKSLHNLTDVTITVTNIENLTHFINLNFYYIIQQENIFYILDLT